MEKLAELQKQRDEEEELENIKLRSKLGHTATPVKRYKGVDASKVELKDLTYPKGPILNTE